MIVSDLVDYDCVRKASQFNAELNVKIGTP